MKTLFLAWQDSIRRSWYPIGRLNYDGAIYEFVYLHGAQVAAKRSSFQPLKSFPDLDKVYESAELFPLFSNRVLPKSRPDYDEHVRCLNIPESQDDPIAMLARSGGQRATDNLEVFPCPEPDEAGKYHIHFFAHGLRHLPQVSLHRIAELKVGERLLLMHDFQNPHDATALMLRTKGDVEADVVLVGYCPRYLTPDLLSLLESSPGQPEVVVERINAPPAPLQLRLLCALTASWPHGFSPFASGLYEPITADISVGL